MEAILRPGYPISALALAFLTGTLAASAPFAIPALFSPNGSGLAIAALIVAAFHTILLAVPTYAWLSRRLAPKAWAAMIAGFAIGAIPVGLLSVLILPDQASIDGVTTVSNGVLTLAGLIDRLVLAGSAGLMGALGGLAFWLTIISTTRPATDGAGKPRLRPLPTAALFIGCLTAMLIAPITGYLKFDRSCHNPLSFGVTSMSPRIYASLAVGPGDWDRVSEIVESVAQDHQLDFRAGNGGSPSYRVFDASACSPSGVIINLLQHHTDPSAFPERADWPSSTMDMSLGVYQPTGGDEWRAPANDLLDRLEAEYGDRVSYTDEIGEPVSRAEAERQ